MSEVKDREHAGLAARDALLQALRSFSQGDFSVRLPFQGKGIDADIASAFNAAAETHERLSRHASRLAERVRQFERSAAEEDPGRAMPREAGTRLAQPARRPDIPAAQAQALRLSMNSMLALAKLLAENEENNLSAKQIDYAQTIYSAGTDLLGVIDELVAEPGAEVAAAPEAYGTVQALIGPHPFLRRRDATGRQPYRGRRSRRQDGDAVLVAHADAAVAAALLERVRANGYDGRVAADLATLRTLLERHRPNAVLLGAAFPDGDGWAALELLRAKPDTRLVPVSMIAIRGDRHTRLEMAGGAQALDAPAAADRMGALREAMADAPDVRRAGAEGRPAASGTEDAVLAHGGGLEDALRQAASFLHDAVGAPLPPRRKFQSRRRRSALDLVGKKVLVVDGDIRRIYAVTGALERQGMLVLHAESGEQAFAVLDDNPDTDAVLIDAGQPDSDALGAIRLMRGRGRDGSAPVIALTGGAAPSSREDCLAAGASDCIAKPIDEEHLVALLRAWLLTRR